MKHFFLATCCFLASTGACAAGPAESLDLRDHFLPDQCSKTTFSQVHRTDLGRLHQVRCRTTARDTVDVFILQTDVGARLLRFPEVQYSPAHLADGLPDWSRVTYSTVIPVPLLLSPHVSADGHTVQGSLSLPPGAGGGRINSTYRLDPSGPVLEFIQHVADNGDHTRIWPPLLR